MDASTVVELMTGGGIVGYLCKEAIHGFFSKRNNGNGNGHLTKADHDLICKSVQQRLDQGDKQFEGIDHKLDTIQEILMQKHNRN